MLLNCGAGEDSCCPREIQPVHPKGNQSWIFIGRTDAKAETPILWPPHVKSWLIGTGEEGDDRGWDGWMASPTRWTWVWVNSGSWWWTGRHNHNSCGCKESDTTERLNWTEVNHASSPNLQFTKTGGVEQVKCWYGLTESRSVVSNSLRAHGLHSPWNSSGQNTGMGSCSLLQRIFPTQGSNPGLLYCRRILYQLSHQGSRYLIN